MRFLIPSVILSAAFVFFVLDSSGQQASPPKASTPAPAAAAPATPDPAVAMWASVKKELTGPGWHDFFELKMRDRVLPDPETGVEHFKGVVVSSRPKARPSELILAMTDGKTPEVRLTLRDARQNLVPLTKPVPEGSGIEFYGIPYDFTQDPFMVSFEVKMLQTPSADSLLIVRNDPPGKKKK